MSLELLEYMRALVLRYVELGTSTSGATARLQLVPALGMCLKLSAEEQARLEKACHEADGGIASSMLRWLF